MYTLIILDTYIILYACLVSSLGTLCISTCYLCILCTFLHKILCKKKICMRDSTITEIISYCIRKPFKVLKAIASLVLQLALYMVAKSDQLESLEETSLVISTCTCRELQHYLCNVLWLAVYAPDVRHRDKSSTTISGYNQRGPGVLEEGHVMTE